MLLLGINIANSLRRVKLKNIWLIVIFLLIISTMSFSVEEGSIFSEEELEWLENHPVIYVAPENDYAPVEYHEDGVFKGMSVDYLNWIGENYDIQFEFVYYETWSEILDALRSESVDIQSALVKTPERMQYVAFTEPYANIPNVVLIRKDVELQINDENLYDFRVGVIKDYAVHEYIRLVDQPDYMYEYTGVEAALSELSLGAIDVLILDLAQASYYIQSMAISNVVISTDIHVNYEYKLRFGTPISSPELASILDKAISSMPEAEKQAIVNKWINPGYYNTFENFIKYIVMGIGIAVSLILVFVVWSMTLRTQVQKKTAELEIELDKSRKLTTELGELTEELESRVKERTDNLMHVNQQLQDHLKVLESTQKQLIESEKLNALSRMVIGIAHQLNTPLGTAITGTSFAESLLERMSRSELSQNLERDLESLKEVTHNNQRCLDKLSTIIMDFNNVANYHYKSDVRKLKMDEEIDRLVELIKHQYDYRHIDFQLDLQEGIEREVSVKSLFQLIHVLIKNALEHGYNYEAGVVKITLHELHDKIHLTITDYGKGIADDEIGNVFEPFVSGDMGGSGLGLFAAYNIVKGILNGDLSISSSEGLGTSIEITF